MVGCKERSTIPLPMRFLPENIINVIHNIGWDISRLACIVISSRSVPPGKDNQFRKSFYASR